MISGGQTGADRAALDAAIAESFACGGWCPSGRRAEDGPLPAVYPLKELSRGGYRKRTIRNIQDSDGTVIFYFHRVTGGTELTLTQCIRLHKPYQLVDGALVSVDSAADAVRPFIGQFAIGVMNVAGPREGHCAGIYAYVRKVVTAVFDGLKLDG